MTRSYRKCKNHLTTRTGKIIGTSIYDSGTGKVICELRKLSNYRSMLRLKAASNEEGMPKVRNKSIPPNPYDDFWAKGRIQTGWR